MTSAPAPIRCFSPIDGSLVAERAVMSPEEVEERLRSARDAQIRWRSASFEERAERCSAFVDAMLAMEGEIVPELARQMGRPVRYGAGELRGFEERARHMIAIAESSLRDLVPEQKPGFERWVQRDPVGLVLVIAPWNYPYLTAVNSVVPALMAGNAVLLKHAAQTLLVGERFAEAAFRAALPEGLLQTLVMNHERTNQVLADGHVDQVNFTGSVPAGRTIEQALAGTFSGLGLELGGKDPGYVCADADLEAAVDGLVDGAFFNSGQSCCGIERVYVHAPLFDEFVERAVELTRAHVLGNPLDEATTMGPMAQASGAKLVREQSAQALAQGAKGLLDAGAFGDDGALYVAPQILVDVDHSMEVMREESFGPVLGVMPVRDEDEAVALMNDSPFGLSASLWTRDPERARALGNRIETGTVFMNRCDYLDPALAWTGVKETGRGVTLSAWGYPHLTRAKSFHLKTG